MWGSKRFWYGLGIGMVVTSVLLRLMSIETSAEPTEPSMNEQTTNEQGIHIDAAESTTDNINEIEQNWTVEEISALADQYGLSVYDKEESRYSEADLEQVRQETLQSIEPETIYVLSIQPGMGTGQVANLLFEIGFIDSKQQFQHTMSDLGLHYRIQTGVFQINEGMNLEEIAYLITK